MCCLHLHIPAIYKSHFFFQAGWLFTPFNFVLTLTWNFWDCNGFKFLSQKNPSFAGRGHTSDCSSLSLVSIFISCYPSREFTWTSFSLRTPCWSRLLLYHLLGTSRENHMHNMLSRCSLLGTWARTLYKCFIVSLVSAVLRIKWSIQKLAYLTLTKLVYSLCFISSCLISKSRFSNF